MNMDKRIVYIILVDEMTYMILISSFLEYVSQFVL